jgi:hypothetical protein
MILLNCDDSAKLGYFEDVEESPFLCKGSGCYSGIKNTGN